MPLPVNPEVTHDSAEMDAEPAQETAGRAEIAGRAETVGVTTPSGVSFTITPAPRDWTVPSKEVEKIKTKLKEFLVNSFSECHRAGRPLT